MAAKMGHPKQVELSLAKMVFYEEGGHFKYHIDTNHQPNMIFTLSVEIFVRENNEGGELILNDARKFEKIPSPLKENELGLAMFYHDVRHKVTKLIQGTRVCLLFDVLEKENS